MKLTLENTTPVNLVRRYGAGSVWVGELALTRACVVGARTLITDFRPATPTGITLADLDPVFALSPEIVVLGWGGGQPFLPARQRAWFLERRIAIEPMELGAACRTYNVLLQDERRAVALLFPSLD